jgi:hypothetical protein
MTKELTNGKNWNGDTVEKEPFMGTIKVSRCQGRADLFDSDVEHMHFIEVEISHADRTRHLSQNWIHGGNQIVSVWMSEIQWAHFLSSMNQGEGSPCTLKHIEGKRIQGPKPASAPESVKFEQEITETVKDSLNALKACIAKLTEATIPKSKSPGKTELNEMLSLLNTAQREFTANLPFVEQQFKEHTEKMMATAKLEFEGYMTTRLRDMGLEAAALTAAQSGAPKPVFMQQLPEGKKND